MVDTLETVQYPKVPHSHIVPAGYLRAWASGRQIAMRQAGSDKSKLVGVRDAGVRKDFYRRRRPSGEATYDIEWSLQQAETAALPVLRDLRARWPLDLEDKGKVGQLFALQLMRGPAFRTWHNAQIGDLAAALREEPTELVKQRSGLSPEDAADKYLEVATTDTYRVTKMLKITRSVATVLCSMHWTLVVFAKARLATSDHPVVVWPLRRGHVRPRANDASAGVIETLEIFAPVAPDALLLMTWLGAEDGAEPVFGEGRHAGTASGFVAANADMQWFHEPRVDPWVATGRRAPLSERLVDRYSPERARRSRRRAKAGQLATASVEEPLGNGPISVVTASRASKV